LPGAFRLVQRILPMSGRFFATRAAREFRPRPLETARRTDGPARNWLARWSCPTGSVQRRAVPYADEEADSIGVGQIPAGRA